MRFSFALISIVLDCGCFVAAHPGHNVHQELAERRDFLANAKRTDLSHCASKIKARGLEQRAVQRRRALAEKKSPFMFKRDPQDLNKTHLSSEAFGADTGLDAVFAANSSCILSPEETQGPYCEHWQLDQWLPPRDGLTKLIIPSICSRHRRICPPRSRRRPAWCSFDARH